MMTRLLIAVATTVALVGPAAAGPRMPTFAVNDWCAGPLDRTEFYHWPKINWRDWPFQTDYDTHESVGNCSNRLTPTHSLVVTADKFTFVSDENVTCHPLVVRKLPYDRDSRDQGSPKSIWFIKAKCDAAYDDDASIEEYVFIDYKGSLVMVSK